MIGKVLTLSFRPGLTDGSHKDSPSQAKAASSGLCSWTTISPDLWLILVALILKLGRSANWQAVARALLMRAERTSALVLSSTGAAGIDCLRTIDGILGGRGVRGSWVFCPSAFLAPRLATSANVCGRGVWVWGRFWAKLAVWCSKILSSFSFIDVRLGFGGGEA